MAKKKKLLSKLDAILSDTSMEEDEKKSSGLTPFSLDSPNIPTPLLEETCQLIENDLFEELEKKLEEETYGESFQNSKSATYRKQDPSSKKNPPLSSLSPENINPFSGPEFSATMSTEEINPKEIASLRNLNPEEIKKALFEQDDLYGGEEKSPFNHFQKPPQEKKTYGKTEKKVEEAPSLKQEEDDLSFILEGEHNTESNQKDKAEESSHARPLTTHYFKRRPQTNRKKIRDAILENIREEEEEAGGELEALVEKSFKGGSTSTKTKETLAKPPSNETAPQYERELKKELEREKEIWRVEKKKLESENRQLQTELGGWHEKTKRLSENGDLEKEVKNLLLEMTEQKSALKEMQQRFEKIEIEKGLIEEEKEGLRKQLNHLVEVAKDLKEIPSIEKFLEYIDATRRQLKKDTSVFYEKVQEKLKKVQDKYFHLEKVVSYVRELKEILKEEILEVQRELQDEKDTRTEFEEKLNDFEERINIAQNHSLFFKEKCREMEKQIEILQSQKVSLQEDAKKHSNEIATDLAHIKENTLLLNMLLKKISKQ